MMEESGSLIIAFSLYGFVSGSMRVSVNETLVVQQQAEPSRAQDMEGDGEQLSYEIYGLQPYQTYAARIEFLDERGAVVGTSQHPSRILPYRDPFDDPPPVHVTYPPALGDEGFPAVILSDRATIGVCPALRRAAARPRSRARSDAEGARRWQLPEGFRCVRGRAWRS
jgi:hypothetical protein